MWLQIRSGSLAPVFKHWLCILNRLEPACQHFEWWAPFTRKKVSSLCTKVLQRRCLAWVMLRFNFLFVSVRLSALVTIVTDRSTLFIRWAFEANGKNQAERRGIGKTIHHSLHVQFLLIALIVPTGGWHYGIVDCSETGSIVYHLSAWSFACKNARCAKRSGSSQVKLEITTSVSWDCRGRGLLVFVEWSTSQFGPHHPSYLGDVRFIWIFIALPKGNV